MMLKTVEKCGQEEQDILQNLIMKFGFAAFSINNVCCYCAVVEFLDFANER